MPDRTILEHERPFWTNLIDLGSSFLRWRKIWTTTLDVSTTATVPTPLVATDAATKAYVDAAVAGLVVEEADGSPSLAGSTTLRFDQADGFVVSNPSGTIARVDITAIPSANLATVLPAQGGTGNTSYAAKGDILVSSGATTLTKLGVGSDTQVLTADSTQATGTKWAAAGSTSLTVQDIDAVPSYAANNIVQFDQADGFVITNPVGGTARIDLAAIPGTLIASLAATQITGSWANLAGVLTGTLGVAAGGTNIASYTAGDMITATGATTLAVLAKGTANQVHGMNNAATTQEYKTITAGTSIGVVHAANAITINNLAPAFWTDPETSGLFWEDFHSSLGVDTGVNAGILLGSGSWYNNSATQTNTITTKYNGTIQISGDDATAAPSLILVLSFSSATIKPVTNITQNPTMYIRTAQLGTGAGTRFFGFAGSALVSAPTNGIYVRHTAAGVLTGVCRKAGVETTISLVTSAANGTFHTFRMVVTGGGTSVEFWIDGSDVGAIATNIPTVDLAPSFGCTSTASVDGIEVDYIAMKATR